MVRRADRFQELLSIPGGDGPYVFTGMFRESDRRERRQSRKNFKLLKRVDGAIREMVLPGEKVVFLTGGRGDSFWERWVLGWRRAVVVTDRRVLHLQLDARRNPRLLHRHVRYEAVTRIEEGRWGRLEIHTRAGDEMELRGLSRDDRETVAGLLRSGRDTALRGDAETRPGAVPGRGVQDLCPHCHRAVEGRPRSCPHCLRKFRWGWLMALLSLLVPGLGNWLLGHRGFAVLELTTAAALWAGYFLLPSAWELGGLREMVGPEWIFGTVHGADALLTWYAARRGIYPSGRG